MDPVYPVPRRAPSLNIRNGPSLTNAPLWSTFSLAYPRPRQPYDLFALQSRLCRAAGPCQYVPLIVPNQPCPCLTPECLPFSNKLHHGCRGFSACPCLHSIGRVGAFLPHPFCPFSGFTFRSMKGDQSPRYFFFFFLRSLFSQMFPSKGEGYGAFSSIERDFLFPFS